MKRKHFILPFILLFVMTPIFSNGQISQETDAAITSYTNKWAVIPEVEQAPELDGTLDDSIWEKATVLSDFRTAYYNEQVSEDVEMKVAFDEDHLYVGLDYTSEDAGESLANVDVFLKPDSSVESYYYIPVEINDPGHPISNDWGPNKKTIEDFTVETTKQDQTVTAEVVVPLSSLGVDEIESGDEWGFNAIIQHQMDTKPLYSWVPIRTSSYFSSTSSDLISMYGDVTDEGRMGSVFFKEKPKEWSSTTQDSTKWNPEQLAFSYKNFTEKELTFQYEDDLHSENTSIELKWKSPNGMWEEIDEVEQTLEAEDAFKVSFSHLEPTEKGTYQLLILTHDEKTQAAILTFDKHSLIAAGDQTFEVKDSVEDKTRVDPNPPSDQVKQLLELIPDKNGFETVGLPDNPDLRPYGLFDWYPSDPWVLTSKHSDLTYPNEGYPEDQVMTVHNRKGDPVEYPYYEDENGKQYFTTAHLWYKQKRYVASELPNVAKEDALGAARLLYRFAEKYEGYVLTHERDWKTYPVDPSSGPPYPYYGGSAWYWWSPAALADLSFLADAFAIVKGTNAFDVLSEEVGEDTEEKIIEEMFEPSVEYVQTFPILNTNMDYYNWLGLTDLGKALNDPKYIHEAVERIEEYVANTYLFDGFFKETTLSYHSQSTGGLDRSINNLEGWSDPNDYFSPRSGMRLDNLDMRAKFPALKQSHDITKLLVYPDGKYLPTQDTWANGSSSSQMDAGSFFLPASGIARFARGVSDVESESGTRYHFKDLEVVEATLDTHYMDAREALLFRNNQGPGHYVTFAFEVDKTDLYDIDLKAFKASSYGIYDIKIDGESIREYNFYGSPSGEFDTLTTMELTEGTHHITFENIGKDEESTDFYMSVMELMILDEEARENRPELGEDESEEEYPAQLYLTYQPKYGHHHFDPLNITLYANNQELLPDIGYTHTLYRKWTNSTMAHNTVVVDGEDMNISGQAKHGGNLDVFASVNGAVQAMRASQETAYTQTDEYSREPWMIQFPDAKNNEGYVLDLFRISGGDRHEYTLQGDANHDGTFETDLALEDYGPYLLPEGTNVIEPEDQYDTGSAEGHYYGYMYVRDVKQTMIEDGKYDLTLVTEDDDEEKGKMKITGLVDEGENELFIGESPSLRATRLHGTEMDNNDEAVKYTMPKMVLRREGTDLTSNFITTMEPYLHDANPRIDSIERLTPDQSVEGDLAVKVTYGDTTDIVLSSLDPDQPLSVGDMTLEGKMGLIRLQDGKVDELYLIGGTSLKKGDMEVTDEGPVTGNLIDVHRQAAGDAQNALITDMDIPADMKGHTIIVTHPDGKTHGYEIEKLSSNHGETMIEIADMDPGFSMDNENKSSELQFFPFTSWEGKTTFRIENRKKASVEQVVNVGTLKQLIDSFAHEEEIKNERAIRALTIHLEALHHFEKQAAGKKVVKHLQGFTQLLDHQQENGFISKKAYETLKKESDVLIEKWQ